MLSLTALGRAHRGDRGHGTMAMTKSQYIFALIIIFACAHPAIACLNGDGSLANSCILWTRAMFATASQHGSLRCAQVPWAEQPAEPAQ